MSNHPNRSWRSRWVVDIVNATATHQDGWIFRFTLKDEGLQGKCVERPALLPQGQQPDLDRIEREAWEIYQAITKKVNLK